MSEASMSDTNPDIGEETDPVTLTLNDVLEFENELIENTAAVLGAANDKTCSYVEGYIKRQALYSCLTCLPEAKTDPEKGVGVCLACSYHCHDGHELVELYTKRNFRCDCGNSKFTNMDCSLYNEKTDTNDLNVYNQNFSGLYCVCHRPFPDPEDPVPDEMIQCIICEDWYHTRHLGTEVPSNNFAEMICEACVTKHEFLLHYDAFCLNKVLRTSEHEQVEVSESIKDGSDAVETGEKEATYCKKPAYKSPRISAKFWVDVNWRKALCTCDDCLKMYENEDVAFLLDSEDPVHLYEEKGKAKAQEVVETHDREFMNSMNRVQLVDCIAGYNDLKERLAEYLKKFAENKKIVREEDIREFFEGMNARKKQRVEVPNFCR
ncbi:putative E3 ubiquitin-protein ligase UBR7 [Leptinotarsa decemlineata]|uniref:putative E3 ubiquitin-protein ligase UBR7 n=1 Tax=Leptinotarsa decemlineata TaxID=7539 RepID=UPI000C25512B|nr:putative E3 ubiquitin-protein ligase UBR7 [Leptinotarsa decemlineata]